MPPVQKKQSKKQSFRIGRYNGWVVVGGVAVAIIAGLYLRNKLSGQTAATQAAATQPATDTSGSSGGSGTTDSGAQPQDLTPVSDLANALNGLTGILGANGGILGAGADPFSSSFGQPFDASTAPTSDSGISNPPPPYVTPVGTASTSITKAPNVIPFSTPGGGKGETLNLRTGLAATAAGRPIVGPQQAPPSDINTSNIASFRELKSGATLTTLKSGAVIEQAPGHTPYTVKKAPTKK